METELKHAVLSGIAWRGLEKIGSTLARFALTIVLARLLLPEQFGLIAMLAIFLQGAGILVGCELPTALIQKKGASHTDECSVFYFNIAASVAAYVALFIGAPFVGRFYGQPQLIGLLRVLSLTIVIGAFGSIHATLLTKRIDFKSKLKVEWVGLLAGGVVGVAMAYGGYGVWALVGQQLVSAATGLLMLWAVSPWRPGLMFSFLSLKKLFSYGSKLLLSRFLNTGFDNIYLMVIGKFFSPVTLGHYHRANNLPMMLTNTVNDTVSSVMFPSYAAMQHDIALMCRTVRRSLKMLCFALTPLLVGLCVTADPVVRILLTEKWLPCVPYLQIISLVFIWTPFHVINLQVLMATGRSDLFLSIEIAKMLIDIVIILVAYRFGMLVLVSSQMVTAVISMVLNSCFSKRLIGYSTLRQLADTAPIALLAAIMGVVVWMVGKSGFANMYVQLAMQAACGAAIYLGGAFLLKIDSLTELVALTRQYLLPHLRRMGR